MTLFITLGALLAADPVRGGEDRTELARVLRVLLRPPQLAMQPGFQWRLLVPPGELYDPLFFAVHGSGAYLSDDGGEDEKGGGQVLWLESSGKLRTAVRIGSAMPILAIDSIPADGGKSEQQLFALTQTRVGAPGTILNHQIVRLDPRGRIPPSPVCVLPSAGRANGGTAGWGSDGRFGPPGTRFAGRFFVVTAYNNMIYAVTLTGRCEPFAEIPPPFGVPLGITFTPDGKSMLASVQTGDAGALPVPGGGAVLKIDADGIVDATPYWKGLTRPSGLAFAPLEFGDEKDELYLTEVGGADAPVKPAQAVADDGAVWRVSRTGAAQLVATGLRNPLGLAFVGPRLWVSDIGGDFMGGNRELPDGFVVEITIAKRAAAATATSGSSTQESNHVPR
jgi:hypothetical protein